MSAEVRAYYAILLLRIIGLALRDGAVLEQDDDRVTW
jgi:hypothetical protein